MRDQNYLWQGRASNVTCSGSNHSFAMPCSNLGHAVNRQPGYRMINSQSTHNLKTICSLTAFLCCLEMSLFIPWLCRAFCLLSLPSHGFVLLSPCFPCCLYENLDPMTSAQTCPPVDLRIHDVECPELLGKLSLTPKLCYLSGASRSDVRILST